MRLLGTPNCTLLVFACGNELAIIRDPYNNNENMDSEKNQDVRSQLLKWLQPFILVLLGIVFILTIRINAPGSYERQAYSFLILLLAVIDILAYWAAVLQKYRLSSLLTIAITLIGSWTAIIIDSRFGLTEFFPLIYVTIAVLLSGVLLPIVFTIVIAAVQLVILTFIVFHSPALMEYNWASFLSYVLIVSVLCIVANYISTHQLKSFQESSIRDHLTGLLNRRYFDVTLEDKIQRGISRDFTYCVMLMDIDNFKKYNDNYSHATGDVILQRVATFLSEDLDRHAIVCRYGGDEFAIIIPDTNHKQLYEIAERLRTNVKPLDITDICDAQDQLSLSIGLAMFPDNGETAEVLMEHADRNLMLAKELGKDRVMPR